MKQTGLIVFILLYCSNTTFGQTIKLKYKVRQEFQDDTLIYERIQKKTDRILFAEYYKNNEPILVWKKYDIDSDSVYNLDFNFDLLYIEMIPENLIVFDSNDTTKLNGVSPPSSVDIAEIPSNDILKNATYPLFAKRLGYQGIVKVLVKVDVNGNSSPIGVVEGITPELDKEALRILRKNIKWKPALSNGSPIESYLIIPIRFSLTDN